MSEPEESGSTEREVKIWDFLNPNTEYTNDEEESTRYSLCMECPEFIKPTTQCKQCGCIMKAKVKLKYATCPIGKW